jgi:hypothetical protein
LMTGIQRESRHFLLVVDMVLCMPTPRVWICLFMNTTVKKRPILSKYMEKSSFSGLALSTGFFWNGLILELGYSTHSGTLIAEGNPAKIAPGSITHRKIDLDLHSINIMGALVYGFDPIYTGPFIEAAFTNIKFETEIEGRGLKRLDMGQLHRI